MRNLELIEQKCLAYLKQTTNPSVDLEILIRHLEQQAEIGEVDRDEFAAFLRAHELFRVIEEDVGDERRTYVVLFSRIPTLREMAAQLDTELLRMAEALAAALREAEAQGDSARAEEVRRMIERARTIHAHLKGGGAD